MNTMHTKLLYIYILEMSDSWILRVGSRLFIIALFAYSWSTRLNSYEAVPDDVNPTIGYGSVWRFLTILNFVLQIGINIFFLCGEVIPLSMIVLIIS